jgi:hypothetical protein
MIQDFFQCYENLFISIYIRIILAITIFGDKAGSLAVLYMPDLAMVQMFLQNIQSIQCIMIIPFRVWNFVSSSIKVKKDNLFQFFSIQCQIKHLKFEIKLTSNTSVGTRRTMVNDV